MNNPVTFEELSYALFDVDQNAVLTTALGNLAIFNTKPIAETWARSSKRNIKVISVKIERIIEQ